MNWFVAMHDVVVFFILIRAQYDFTMMLLNIL
jgi:hypothetical protein